MLRKSGLVLGVAVLMSGAALPAFAQALQPWASTSLSSDQRADLVLQAMTLDEKIAMVNGNFGSVLRKANPGEKRIGGGHVSGVPRLGIPDLYESDASLGVANGGSMRPGDVATALPSSLATAASFDPVIAYAGGAMIGAEARAKGFNVLLAGGANLIRDPWNGRDFEYLGEDTLLTGVMAGQGIRGVQSNGIISTVKHYALNAQESGRYVLDARIPKAALRESDLLAFEIAIEDGDPGSVMCGYNKVNGDWDCENAYLLTDVLKHDWNYAGWIMSDWGAVHSTAKAASAGLDQESGQELDRTTYFAAPLKAAVTGGEVPQARLDDMVRRILRSMFSHGLIDNPAPQTPQAIDYPSHALVAQRTAEAGMVLLKNNNALLPLAKGKGRILVIGAHADVGVISGGGSSQVQSVSGTPIREPPPKGGPNLSFIKKTYHGSSPLAAIRARMPDAAVSYLDSRDPAVAAAAARQADLIIVFAEQWRTEAIDLESLALPDGQDALIAAVAAANPHTAVVLETGGAVLMPWRDQVGAIVEAWYPGERGGEAIARILFGEVDPQGRLPVTFPASEAQAPRPQIPGLANVKAAAAAQAVAPPKPKTALTTVDITGGVQGFAVDYPEGADVGYRWYQRTNARPLYPFGYGLSYTHFAYSDLQVTGGATPRISFMVRNDGARAGGDTPQLYGMIGAEKPIARLIGFEHVVLEPGQSRSVELTVDPRLLARYDTQQGRWILDRKPIAIAVGRDVEAMVLKGQLVLPPPSGR